MNDSKRQPSILRFATFLSANLYGTYKYISKYVGGHMGRPTELAIGQSLEDFASGQAHVGFVCGLPYSLIAQRDDSPLELVAAPVLRTKRYQGKPIYFSDIIVRRDSPFTSFDDLQGCVWGYNESTSHSGWNIVCYTLIERLKRLDYFGKMVRTGSHLRSLEMVVRGEIDAAAIDSHVLDVFRLQHADLNTRFRVIDTFGPSSIPPVVVSKSLDPSLKHDIQHILLHMHYDPLAVEALRGGLIAKFVPVSDEHYQHMYTISALVQEWNRWPSRMLEECFELV